MSTALTHRRTTQPARRPSIELALGGGGARGLGHILMLEAFDELGLRPTVIAGTSIGAMFGAAYASGMTARQIRAHVEEVLSQRFDLARQLFAARHEPMQRLLSVLSLRSALLNAETLLELLLPARVAADFADLAIPMKIVATDYCAHEAVIFTSGPLKPAIAASIALPALFAPVKHDGRVLMDGGLVNPLPFDVVSGAADISVAIDVSGAPRLAAEGEPQNPSALEALVAASQILQRTIVSEKLKSRQPDVYIDVDVDRFHVLEFYRFKPILAAAEPAKAALKKQLSRVLAGETLEPL